MLDGSPLSPYSPEYFRQRAVETLELAASSQFEEVRGDLLRVALQYRELAQHAETLAASSTSTQALAQTFESRHTNDTPAELAARAMLFGSAPSGQEE